ncbi:MAG: hypothetical protein O2888_03710 [Chloroflexi bacterium]|nr:hypothetical protein [Chloroflexota bacterium]
MTRRDDWLRRLARAPGAKRAAIPSLVASVLFLALACDSDVPAPIDAGEGAFYLEARIEVSPGGPDLAQPSLLPAVSVLRWWHLDDRHYRHEIESVDTLVQEDAFVIVADGAQQAVSDPRVGIVYADPLPDAAVPFGARPPISVLLGPLPAGSLDEFIDQRREGMETVERAGTAEVMGRAVEVVEFGPIWSESDSRGDGVSVERSGGLGRIYVDTGLGMVLRYEVVGNEGRGQDVHAEVTLLDLEPEFTTATFAIEGAAGRVAESPGSSRCEMHGSGGSGMWTFGSGLLRPGYDPEGWAPAGSGSIGGSDCAVVEEWGALARGEGEVIIFTQAPLPEGEAPAIHDSALRVDLEGIEGYRATTEGASGTVDEFLWVQDGIIARLQTNAAPFEELVRIAESVEVVP